MEKKRFKKIYIEITNICNLNCEFCIKSNREKRQMSVSEFEMVMKKIQGYTDGVFWERNSNSMQKKIIK